MQWGTQNTIRQPGSIPSSLCSCSLINLSYLIPDETSQAGSAHPVPNNALLGALPVAYSGIGRLRRRELAVPLPFILKYTILDMLNGFSVLGGPARQLRAVCFGMRQAKMDGLEARAGCPHLTRSGSFTEHARASP